MVNIVKNPKKISMYGMHSSYSTGCDMSDTVPLDPRQFGCKWKCIGPAYPTLMAYASTHLPLDKMAAISQMIFSDAISWKVLYFDHKFIHVCS